MTLLSPPGPPQQLLPLPSLSLDEMVRISIEALRLYQPPGGYKGAFSGGKDSIVIKRLAQEAGVKVEWHYHVTTLDPPELIRFIKGYHADVIWDRQPQTLLKRAVVKGLPTRRVRWCCQEYKEEHFVWPDVVIVGVRAAESRRRAANWQLLQRSRGHIASVHKHWILAPIVHWLDQHVWEFVHDRRLPYCSLYDEGFKRLGCIGCPMVEREREFARWPGFERQWVRAARECYQAGRLPAIARFQSFDEYWQWWMGNKDMPDADECQMSLALSGGSE